MSDPTMEWRIPVLPVLESGDCRDGQRNRNLHPGILDLPNRMLLDSGCTAIAMALRYAGVRAHDEVLIPAYHCPTMVTPVHEIGAQAVFYQINWDTTIDLASVESKLSSRSKAILVPHFFGIKQDVAIVRDICDKHKLAFIEDCAHAFFGTNHGKPIGAAGDFAIASSHKFFAGADGGVLASATQRLKSMNTKSVGFATELKSCFDLVEVASGFGTLGSAGKVLRPFFGIKRWLRRMVQRHDSRLSHDSESVSSPLDRRGKEYGSMSRVSQYLLFHADMERICRTRTENFNFLASRLQETANTRSLANALQRDAVPYMYPLIVDDPDIYHVLRQKKWPLWRWDDANTECKVSRHYARHLVQIPCHQSLNQRDLGALVEDIKYLCEGRHKC